MWVKWFSDLTRGSWVLVKSSLWREFSAAYPADHSNAHFQPYMDNNKHVIRQDWNHSSCNSSNSSDLISKKHHYLSWASFVWAWVIVQHTVYHMDDYLYCTMCLLLLLMRPNMNLKSGADCKIMRKSGTETAWGKNKRQPRANDRKCPKCGILLPRDANVDVMLWEGGKSFIHVCDTELSSLILD